MKLNEHFDSAAWLSGNEKTVALALFRKFRRHLLNKGAQDSPLLNVRLTDFVRQWLILQRIESAALNALGAPDEAPAKTGDTAAKTTDPATKSTTAATKTDAATKAAAAAQLALLDYVHKQRESLHAELDELEALGEPAESEADDEEGDDAPTGALVTNLADYMKPVIEEMQACTGLHPGVNDLKDLIEWCVRQDLRGEYFPQWTPNLQLSREADVARGREADPPEEHQAHERKTPEEMDRELLAQIGLETDPARYDAGQDHAGQDGTRQEDAEYDAVYDAP